MPVVRQKQKIRVQSLNGGEDSTSESSIVQQPYASLMRNGDISELGKVAQRLGNERVGDNPDTLVVDMRFHDSSATDFEGNILDSNVTETSITYGEGKFGMAAGFNGTTSVITVAAAETEFSINALGACVIEAWIYVNSDGEGSLGRIIDKFSGTHVGYRLNVNGLSAGTVKLTWEVGYSTTNAIVTTSTTLSISNWHRIRAIHNADKSLDIYIDGVLASYSTDTTGVGTLGDDTAVITYIGNRAGNDRTFDGSIEYLRVYDGTISAQDFPLDKIYGLTRFTVGASLDTLYRVRDIYLEYLNGDQKGWSQVAGLSLTADTVTNLVQADDRLFILNGVDNVFSIDKNNTVTDEGSATASDPPKSTVGVYTQNNRLFLAGSPTESLRDIVFFSDADDTQTFDTTAITGQFFKVASKRGGKITWLEPFKLNELIIYKEDSIFVLDMTGTTPLTDWVLQPLNISVGCRAGRTVQDIGNDHVFLDDQKTVRLLSRTSFDKIKSSIISAPVQGILDTININSIQNSCSTFVNGKYYLSIPTGTNTENNVTLIWDTSAAGITGKPDSGWSVVADGIWYPSVFTFFEFGDNEISVVHSDNRQLSLVYKHTADTDDGRTIEMEASGPVHDFGERATDKIWGPLHTVWESGENTTVEIFAEIDETGFESVGTFSLLGSAPVLPIDLPFQLSGSEKKTQLIVIKQIGRGKICRVKARHANYNNTATFIEYELWAESRIPRNEDRS